MAGDWRSPAVGLGYDLSVFDWLTGFVSSSPLTYLVVFGAVGLDAIVPLIPGETVVITAAVLSVHGSLLVWLLVLAAALGGFVGDNGSYFLGRGFGTRAAQKLFRGERGKARFRWAERVVRRYGVWLILAARFVPGGRTATTFAAGTMEMSWPRFAIADAAAAMVWATYVTLLGYFGGQAFRDRIWLGLLVAFAAALGVSAAVEGVRRMRKRRAGAGSLL